MEKITQELSIAELIELLGNLNLPTDQFVLFGDAPLFLHRLVEGDELATLDVVAHKQAWEMAIAQAEKVVFDKTWKAEYVSLEDGKIIVWKGWGPGAWDVSHLIRNATVTNSGLRFARLKDVLSWKQARKSEADLAMIEALKACVES